MPNRFPSVEYLRSRLTTESYAPGYYAEYAGTLLAMYSRASEEFEELRALATKALDGTLDDAEELRAYLKVTDEIGVQYQREADEFVVRV